MNKLNPNILNISYNHTTEIVDLRRLETILYDFTTKINELVEYTTMMEKYYDLYVYAKPSIYGGFSEWINTPDFHRLSQNWYICKMDISVFGIDDISRYIDFLNRKHASHSITMLEEYKFGKIITNLLD